MFTFKILMFLPAPRSVRPSVRRRSLPPNFRPNSERTNGRPSSYKRENREWEKKSEEEEEERERERERGERAFFRSHFAEAFFSSRRSLAPAAARQRQENSIRGTRTRGDRGRLRPPLRGAIYSPKGQKTNFPSTSSGINYVKVKLSCLTLQGGSN